MACNNFGVIIIFNMEDFANKDIRVKRRGLINFIDFYGYYMHILFALDHFQALTASSCALF